MPAAPRPRTRPHPPASVRGLRLLAWLGVLVPVVAYAAVGGYLYQQMRSETALRMERSLAIAVEHAQKVLDTTDVLQERVLDMVAGLSARAVAERADGLHAQLRSLIEGKPQINSVWVFGPDGAPLVSSLSRPPPVLNAADRDYFVWHQEHTGRRFVSGPLVSRASGLPFFTISAPRPDNEGIFGGVVAVSMLPRYFQQFHAQLVADEPGMAVTLFREDGHIYSRWPQLSTAPMRLAADSPVMSRITAGQAGGAAPGISSVDGRERLLFYRKVGDYPVYLGTGMAVREIQQRWLREMAWLVAFSLPLVAGLWWAARTALRRTHQALGAAEELQAESAARERVEEALRQAQKLEALGRLTGGVAHDFNNALMVISNNLFLLRRKHPGADGPQADAIARAVDSATKLTRQLLAFSRRQALVPAYLRLDEHLPTLRPLIEPVLGNAVGLEIAAAEGTGAILVDAAEFELAVINLAVNARDAMPQGGTFALSARSARPGELPPLLQGDMVVVEARDTGTGIAPDILDKVFEPFFTTKPVGHGTGLGLSQIYGLAQRAGGTATVESRVGAGTTVRLYFPAAPARAPQAVPEAIAPEDGLRLSLLLVEDNDAVAGALQPMLEAMGCTVHRVDRGATARDWLAAQPALPDVVLSDVVMPGELDGLALAQLLRAAYPSLRLVLMTGYAEQLDAIGRLGFTVLPKPCSARMLADAFRRTERRAPTG